MPTGIYSRSREDQSRTPFNHDLAEQERLAQLQRAVQQPRQNANVHDSTTAATASSSSSKERDAPRNADSTRPTDGARNPIGPGADYASLRLITRRQPDDPGPVLAGLDTSNADLSWTAREASSGLDPNGQPWLYPKKRGKGEGSNLDQFKDEIEQRTKNGQGCKAIAEAMIAKGVDTSSRAVARQRMKWGLRQRAPRRMTEQGIANIRKAHLEQAKRLANSDPVPVKRVRIRVMRKAEITRMTKEGMSAAEIAENLVARGVKLKRGAATVERLRTVWGLTGGAQRSVATIRATARNHALKHQKEQFENIARELGIEDVDAWVRSKMDEDVAQEARREYALKLMGDAKPKPLTPEEKLRNAERNRQLKQNKIKRGSVFTRIPGVDFVPNGGPGFSPGASAGHQGAASTPAERAPMVVAAAAVPPEAVEVSSDDDEDTEDEEMDGEMDGDLDVGMDGEVSDLDEAGQVGDAHQETPPLSAEAQRQTLTAMDMDSSLSTQSHLMHCDSIPQRSPAPRPSSPPPQVNNVTSDPSLSNTIFYKQYGYKPLQHSSESNEQPGPANITAAPPAGLPGRPPSFVNVAPRSMPPRPIAPRAIAPRPVAPLPASDQHRQKIEADYMAQFGLYPYPTRGKPPQKYLTPTGLITTDGYEYLAIPPQRTGTIHPYPQLPAGTVRLPTQPGTDVILVPPPPSVKVSKIPAPPLIMSPEEVRKHKDDSKTIEAYQKVTQECLEVLAARTNSRPLANSLTGLPPSVKDVQNAKEKLKEAAEALLAEL